MSGHVKSSRRACFQLFAVPGKGVVLDVIDTR